MTFPGVAISAVFGGSPRKPAGLTMTYSTPDACRCFSPTSFSSSTPPKALVILNPGESAAPMARPSVRMDDMRTTRLTPAALAASTMCTTPSLSTAWAALDILNGLPGTNPVHTTATSVFFMRSARMSAGAVTSKLGRSATPPLSMPSLVAFSGERTAAVMSAPPRLRSSSTTSWPVWPVAPMTRIFGLDAGAGGGGGLASSANAMDATDALETSVSAARAPEMASRRPVARTSTGSSSEDLATTTIFPVDLRPRASAEPRTAERTERDAGRLAMETRAVRRTGATREVDIAGRIVTESRAGID